MDFKGVRVVAILCGAAKREGVRAAFLGMVASVLLAGCDKPAPEPPPVRSVKTFVYGSPGDGGVRKYAAQVRSAVRSSLAFQVGGRVVETKEGVGDRVQKGAVLARLDEQPFLLKVQQAQAEVRRSEAALVEAARKVQAQRQLLTGGFGTRQELDQALAAETAARSAVQSATSALALSQRDAASTTVRAPHAGIVAARTVESFTEVQAGQVVFEIDGETGVEIVASVPIAVATQLRVGQGLAIHAAGAAESVPVQITSIGQRSTGAETVAVIAKPKVASLAPLAPGSYAELRVQLPAAARNVTVPLAAVIPGSGGTGGAVFVVGQDQKIQKRVVELGPLTQSGVEVRSGLKSGESIVATGVGFLRDGQQVHILSQPAQ